MSGLHAASAKLSVKMLSYAHICLLSRHEYLSWRAYIEYSLLILQWFTIEQDSGGGISDTDDVFFILLKIHQGKSTTPRLQ